MAEKLKISQDTKISLTRKGNKPLMEKRRRARINHHLDQLAGLLSEGRKKDSTRHSKLEKADILEMTVKYVKDLQNQLNMQSITADPNMHSKYRIGYKECASEVTRYLSSAQSIDEGVRNRITDHLANSINVTRTNHPQGSKPVSRVENIEKKDNTSEITVQKTEVSKQELPAPATRTTASPTANPMKSIQVNIPNSLPLSGITIPVLAPGSETLLSPQTAAISLCDNPLHPDSLTMPENCRLQSTVATAPNLGKTQEKPTPKAAMEISQNRRHYFHQSKQTVSVQPFLTTNTPAVKVSAPSSTRPTDKKTTPVTEPLLVKLSPSQVAGSFQIIPGSIYSGQPVALYLAPTATIPTAPEHMTSSSTNALPRPAITAASTTNSDSLSIHMPQVVTAVVSPPTLGLLSPQAATPAPTSLPGSTCFSHLSSSLPLSASVSTSSYNPSLFAPTSGQIAYPQRLDTGNHSSSLRANHLCSSENEQSLWRPW